MIGNVQKIIKEVWKCYKPIRYLILFGCFRPMVCYHVNETFPMMSYVNKLMHEKHQSFETFEHEILKHIISSNNCEHWRKLEEDETCTYKVMPKTPLSNFVHDFSYWTFEYIINFFWNSWC
jgi:hypothetical protein